MDSIAIYSTLALVLGLVIAWLVHSQGGLKIVVQPEPEQLKNFLPDPLPMISVIIPARNEQRNIHRCVQTLLEQTYPNFEIIVIDDRSSDETPQILAKIATQDPRIRVIQGNELPPGWAGKPHALVQGVTVARGEWFCFMDADTFSHPALLASTLGMAYQYHADMFTLLTEQVLGSFWERTILPLVFLGLSFGFPADRVNDPAKPDAIANGQFILIKRDVYVQVGGHEAVKDHIDEDRALAAVAKRSGFRLVLADGRKVAGTRMYTSLQEMWEGWTKNIFLGLKEKHALLLFGATLGLMVSILLPVWLVGSLTWLATGGGTIAVVVAVEVVCLWCYLLWERSQACKYFNISAWYAFTFPLGAFMFTLMMLSSTFNVLSGRGVRWKGRQYK